MRKSVKLLFILCTCLTSYKMYSQTSMAPLPDDISTFQPSSDFMSKMGEVLSSPPNTAAIEKYGGVDIDLNTGVVKKSISLRPFISYGITVPLNLGFSSLGLRVNEYPSRVGMGWSFIAGGQISRVIYGNDDLISTRYPPNFTVNPSQDDPQATAYAYHLLNEGVRDATPDIFSFNFGNYSGKFFFDNNSTIQQIEISNLKIEYSPNIYSEWTFKITTPDGSIYLFGGSNATEKTKIGGTKNFNDYVPNAWHLIKITDKNSHSVLFNYEEDYITQMLTDISQTQYKNGSSPTTDCILSSGIYSWPIYVTANASMTASDISSYMSSKPKRLKRIYNQYGDSLVFEYSTTGYPEKLLNQVKYYFKSNSIQYKYSFDYSIVISGTSTLPFLTKITESGSNSLDINSGYKFNYYSKQLVPQRFSFSQDHWGFYNGKLNSNLVPLPEDPQVASNFPYATANREPDSNYTKIGLLSSIIYPTGGRDSIVYESNTKTESKDVNPYDDILKDIVGINETSYAYTSDHYFNINYDTRVKVNITSQYTILNAPSSHPGSQVIIKNGFGQVVFNKYLFPPESGVSSQDYYINLPVGIYSFVTGAQGLNVRTTSDIKIRSGFTPNIQSVQTIIGGVRVKKVISTDFSNKSDVVKRYYYGTLANKEMSTAQFDRKPNYYLPSITFNAVIYDFRGCLGVYCMATNNASVMYSSPREKIYASDGKLTEYTSVIESIGGDNFESGAIEHKFHVATDAAPQIIREPIATSIVPYSNSSIWSLGETETNIYKKEQGGLIKIMSTQNEMTIDSRKTLDFPFYFASQMKAPQCTHWNGDYLAGPSYIHNLYSIARFNIGCAWKYLKKQRQIVYDVNGLNPLTSETEFEYNDLQYLMLTKKKFTNSKGEVFVEEFKYPADFSSTYPYYLLLSSNQLNPIIEQTSSVVKSGNLVKPLSKTHVDYQVFGSSVIEPFEVFKSTESYNPVSQIRIMEYDSYGNIRRTIGKDGINTIYVWGYEGKYVVAKVSVPLLTYSELISQSGLSESLINDFTVTPAALRIELDKLRNISGALVSTYTFKYPIGMLSETDPNRISKYYEYDQFGRLVVIRDNENNILKKLCYNYSGQQEDCPDGIGTTLYYSDEMTAVFTKNNCSGCQIGSQVSYTVPAGRYTSTTSKLAANQLAQNDLNSNGQANANLLGYCTAGTGISISFSNVTSYSGYTAVYTNTNTNINYVFSIPNSTSGVLGCIPSGKYSLYIYKSGLAPLISFSTGCQIIEGTSAFFGAVSISSCNQIIIN